MCKSLIDGQARVGMFGIEQAVGPGPRQGAGRASAPTFPRARPGGGGHQRPVERSRTAARSETTVHAGPAIRCREPLGLDPPHCTGAPALFTKPCFPHGTGRRGSQDSVPSRRTKQFGAFFNTASRSVKKRTDRHRIDS